MNIGQELPKSVNISIPHRVPGWVLVFTCSWREFPCRREEPAAAALFTSGGQFLFIFCQILGAVATADCGKQ